MAKDQIEQFLALADTVRAAKSLADRADSLERACQESQTRLADLRDQESKAGASVAQAYDEAKRVAAATKAEADLTWRKTEESCQARWVTCQDECAKAEAASRGKVAALEAKAETAAHRVDDLEDEYTCLAQSVTSLKSELEQLKAKFA